MADRTDKDDPTARRVTSRAAAPQPEIVRDVTGDIIGNRFSEFLNDFCSSFEGETSQTGSSQPRINRDYIMQVETMRNDDTTTIYVDWNHLLAFDAELSEAIELEFFRCEPYLRNAVRDFVEKTIRDAMIGLKDTGQMRYLYVGHAEHGGTV